VAEKRKKVKFQNLLSFSPILFLRWKLSKKYLVAVHGNFHFVQTSKTVGLFTNLFTGGNNPNNSL
jgi:hypothetical protein